MRSAAILLVFVTSCAEGSAKAPLDYEGRKLLDPVRLEALRPTELIHRLALRSDARVADIGAGPGFLTLPLARAVPGGTIDATDVRADYLRVLAERAESDGITNITTHLARPDAPGLAAGSEDAVILCQVDQYVPDRATYFKALVPALGPGGKLVVVNQARFRDTDEAALRAAGWRVIASWNPSPPFFALIAQPTG
jgi:trans-aconitate methyltransferase